MGLSRRELLAGGAAAVGSLAVGASQPARASAALWSPGHAPKVVIVGAGLAGLACADVLHRNGIRAAVFEARPDRIGGRCWSSHGWVDGQVAEHGGEFLDTRHTRMQALARRFGLELDDTFDIDGAPRLWLKGGRRRRASFSDEMQVFRQRLHRLARRIGPYHYRNASREARAVDEMTAREVVDAYLPGGSSSVSGHAVHQFLASFLGLDLDDLGGLAVIDNVIGNTAGADERYHVHGGNDQIVTGLADSLPRGTVTMNAPLTSVAQRRDATYELRFDGVGRHVVADHVVFCLPFTTLRRVDLGGLTLSRRKRRCIDELGMGSNAKVILQLEDRPHAYGGWNGYLETDRPYFDTWESSAGQPGSAGLMTVYFGGRSGAAGLPARSVHGRAPSAVVDDVLREITRHGRDDLPGLRHGFLGRAQIDHWTRDPWTRGSYAAFLPGQYTRYAGFVGRPEGKLHFAGEHTAPLTNQGYLEGAVRTGERAGREVLAAVGRRA